jgi:hypothetical protein
MLIVFSGEDKRIFAVLEHFRLQKVGGSGLKTFSSGEKFFDSGEVFFGRVRAKKSRKVLDVGRR